MSDPATWTDADTMRARAFWEQYQQAHDVSNRRGQAVGIDPTSGRVWFGDSALDIHRQQEAAGETRPLHVVRVGHDDYQRKGRRH